MDLRERLRDLLHKYDLLVALRQGEEGRTTARRDAMREVADRFPAALREWDVQPLGELVRRRQIVQMTLAQAEQGGDPEALQGTTEAWLRYGLDLHPHLREVLRLHRLGALSRPPGGRVTEIAFAQVAARHGVSIAEIKHALFHPAGPEQDLEAR